MKIEDVRELLLECNNRNHIEQRLEDAKFEILFKDRDDYIWADEKMETLIFISWIDIVAYIYQRVDRIELR